MDACATASRVCDEKPLSARHGASLTSIAEPLALDPQMQQLLRLLESVAASPLPVVLLGETGCGKEVLAEWVHRRSALAERPLVRINCAGLTESLIESELFGHERGAFTGAVQAHQGVFEVADGGTLFLDEVAELPLRTQSKLLRVLESGEYVRVGGKVVRRTQVRLIAATHAELALMVARGEFRRDLYFRLNGATVEIPPLRARRAEILPLAEHFLQRARCAAGRPRLRFGSSARAALLDYTWPGNVRELRNVVDCAVALCSGDWLGAEHLLLGRPLHALPAPAQSVTRSAAPAVTSGATRDATPVGAARESSRSDIDPGPTSLRASALEAERASIQAALERTGGNQTAAAKLLGIARRTLTKKLTLHHLARPRDKARAASGSEQREAEQREGAEPESSRERPEVETGGR